MQPISVISPIVQPSSSKCLNPFSEASKVQRNQSFHGFQSAQKNVFPAPNFAPGPFLNLSLQNLPQFLPIGAAHSNQLCASVLYRWPSSFNYFTGTGNSANIAPSFPHHALVPNPFYAATSTAATPTNTNPFSYAVGKHRLDLDRLADIRRSRSGINDPKTDTDAETVKKKRLPTDEKRFSSLELRKHKCYSPTFYSMRCRKHAKKRPVLYAMPKKPRSELNNSYDLNNSSYENLTDSIQIMEENASNTQREHPKPAPRQPKKKTKAVYANVSDSIQNRSESSSDNCESQTSVSITEALVHTPDTKREPELESSKNSKTTLGNEKLSPIGGKNNTPVLKVSPNCVKPKIESPKGALYMKLQAKMKASSPNNKREACAKSVPQMPLLEPKTKWMHGNAATNHTDTQVCASFLFVC